jgi:transglutaminase-like putative cysteine protease
MARRYPLAPAEGWLSLGLVTLLCLTMAWSIDDATWVLGRDPYTDFLSFAALGGVVAGFVGAKVAWSRWLAHVIGATFGALLVPMLVGTVLERDASPVDAFLATGGSLAAAFVDLAILRRTVTTEYGHFLLIIGLFVWATALFASFATFGHRRPLSAVVVVGIVLVANMSLTTRDQLFLLVVFSLAALFLLIRFHVLGEQSEWLRRRIGDPSSISSVYLRGGTVFIGVAVVGSLLLTQTASSAPLAGAWRGLGDTLIDLSRDFQRFLPTGGSNRSLGVSFGSSASISGIWTTDPTLAATIEVPATAPTSLYWRAVTYDRFEGTVWSKSATTQLARDADAPLLAETADAVTEEGRIPVTFTVTPEDFRDAVVLSPATPQTIDEPVQVSVVGEAGHLTTIDRDRSAGSYTVTALIPLYGDADPKGLTENRLRVAGTDYPQEIRDLYLQQPEPLGPSSREVLADILARAGDSDDPYDIARAAVAELKSNAFRYETDVRGLDCEGISRVECFARFKQGYCQYYATTMAILLREVGIPTRMAEGFLPGTRELSTGTERIYNSNAHAWVEVYFPGFGWVDFDPTGGGVSRLAPLPSGRPEASPSATASGAVSGPTRPPEPSGLDREEPEEGATGGAGTTDRGSTGPLIAVAFLLLAAVGALAFLAWQRGPRGPTTPEGAYGSVTRIASRLGFVPRPNETVYEYAGALGDVLPAARPHLETVARAKVEVAYGRGLLGEERLRAIRAAERRLRVTLLRLALIRRGRRR